MRTCDDFFVWIITKMCALKVLFQIFARTKHFETINDRRVFAIKTKNTLSRFALERVIVKKICFRKQWNDLLVIHDDDKRNMTFATTRMLNLLQITENNYSMNCFNTSFAFLLWIRCRKCEYCFDNSFTFCQRIDFRFLEIFFEHE